MNFESRLTSMAMIDKRDMVRFTFLAGVDRDGRDVYQTIDRPLLSFREVRRSQAKIVKTLSRRESHKRSGCKNSDCRICHPGRYEG